MLQLLLSLLVDADGRLMVSHVGGQGICQVPTIKRLVGYWQICNPPKSAHPFVFPNLVDEETGGSIPNIDKVG